MVFEPLAFNLQLLQVDTFFARFEDHSVAGVTSITELLEAGIKAEHLRQKTIASNLANIETPGYRRVQIRFEELLEKALKSARQTNITELEPEVYHPQDTPVKPNGNDVSLEGEIGQMIQNSLRHKAYVRLLNKKYQQIAQAIQTP